MRFHHNLYTMSTTMSCINNVGSTQYTEIDCGIVRVSVLDNNADKKM